MTEALAGSWEREATGLSVRAVTGVKYTWTQVQVNDAEWKEQRLYFILKTSRRTADVCNNARNAQHVMLWRCRRARSEAQLRCPELDESQLLVVLSLCLFFFFLRGHQRQKMTRRPVMSIDSLQSLTVTRAETSKPYIQWRTSSIETVATKRVPPVSNPYFLVFGYYFVIFTITVVENEKKNKKLLR